MAYRELPPPPALAPHVACLWTRSGRGGRVLPDGCVDIVWTGARLVVPGPATRAGFPDVRARAPKGGLRLPTGAAAGRAGVPPPGLREPPPPLADGLGRGRREPGG